MGATMSIIQLFIDMYRYIYIYIYIYILWEALMQMAKPVAKRGSGLEMQVPRHEWAHLN